MPRASCVLLAVVAASCSAAHESGFAGDAAGRAPDAFVVDAFAPDAFAPDAFAPDAFVDSRVPRPIAPLSTATVTSQTPTLHWALGAGSDGVHVDLCRDRALTVGCVGFDATGTSGRPASPLAAGAWFWRISTRRR